MNKVYASVYLLDVPYGIDKPYTYFIPEEIRESIEIGRLCIVPFGMSNRRQTAVIHNFLELTNYPQIKPIEELIDSPVNLTHETVGLCEFIKERFFCTFGAAVKAILPPGMSIKKRAVYKVLDYDKSRLNEKGEFIYDYIRCKGTVAEREITDEFGEEVLILLGSLIRLGAIKKETEIRQKVNEKVYTVYRLSSNISPDEIPKALKGEKQQKIFEFVRYGSGITIKESADLFGASYSVFKTMVKNGILEKFEERSDRIYKTQIKETKSYTLNEDQQNAYNEIAALMETGEAKAALLYGVTGSGKTKVIIEACKKCLKDGKTAIVLLPEIGLAAQASGIYAAAFGEDMAVIHSMLSNGERIDTYRSIEEGKIKIVIGTRSAVFAPLKNIGIIAIDEEQEHTYKSEMSPKYHARDIARYRSAYHKLVMLLCSATPSIESFYKAEMGIYKLIKLKERFNETQLPHCGFIDLRKEKDMGIGNILSQTIRQKLIYTAKAEGQSILFINRRGYNSYLSCALCGYVYVCPNCSVSLTYHAYGREKFKNDRLVCHYCGYNTLKPVKCDNCGGEHIGYYGSGTQKLQDEIEESLPAIQAVRMDADTTAEKYSHEEILKAFSKGEYNLLFGTQMIAKGLDFPKVELVGVVNADSMLYMNDFRAGERTFSLITQLIGRSGRGEKQGEAVIQTYNPDNEILRLAAQQDYEKFYESEILLRKSVLFPPFCDIAVFTFSAEREDEVQSAAEKLGAIISTLYTTDYTSLPLVRLGPYKNNTLKLKNKYHQRIILKYKDKALSREYLSKAYELAMKSAPAGVSVDLEVNPSMI